ncbi:MAG: glutathione peroxidase [Myxococcota bacterium]
MSALYTFRVRDIDGEDVDLRTFEGRTLLLVNLASRCGFTPQYAGLQQLHERYEDRGFSVLGFPCNQFGAQEPGSDPEVKAFATSKYQVTFPLFAKIEVNGPNRHELYAWLTTQPTEPEGPGDIRWNFEKFLVDRTGSVVGRYSSRTTPADLMAEVERWLGRD